MQSHKEVTKQRKLRFFLPYYFCLMMEGSGTVPPTNGSGTLLKSGTPYRKGVQQAFPKVKTGSYAHGIDDVYDHYRI